MRELPDQPGMCSLDLARQFASYASLGIIFNSVAFQFPYQQIALSVLVCLLGYCEPKYVHCGNLQENTSKLNMTID